MTKKQRALEIIEKLKAEYPDAGCTLDYDQAWKLLVSVRLAAQCTDARVNVVVEKLYEKYPDVNALAEAPVEKIEEIVQYAFGTDLNDPSEVIARPSGVFLVPLGKERVGDVSNVVFTNGAVARENGDVYIYYASCDTRMHVAATTIAKLEDYLFHTPEDALRSPDCVRQRCELIEKNLKLM